MLITALALALTFDVHDAPKIRCSVGTLRNNPEGYVWPLSNIRAFVTESEVIVRAKAIGIGPAQDLPLFGRAMDKSIEFEILEVLKGDRDHSRLFVPGDSTSNNNFNSGVVPYRIVRSAGQRGNCIATSYKIGGEYLLLLRSQEGVLNPYWAPLAPLNEQINGRDDAWVNWIREQVG